VTFTVSKRASLGLIAVTGYALSEYSARLLRLIEVARTVTLGVTLCILEDS
jgi:hypothetical protein